MFLPQIGSRRQRTEAVVIPLNAPRIEPDAPGGWFVTTSNGQFGWLYSSRTEAVNAARKLANEVRP